MAGHPNLHSASSYHSPPAEITVLTALATSLFSLLSQGLTSFNHVFLCANSQETRATQKAYTQGLLRIVYLFGLMSLMFHRNLYFTSPSFLYCGGEVMEKKMRRKINQKDLWLVSSEVKASHVENRVGTAVWGRKTGWASSSPGCNYLLKTKQNNKKKCTCEYTPLKTDTYLTSEVPTFGFTMAELTVFFGVTAASHYGHIQLAGLSNYTRSLKGSKAHPMKRSRSLVPSSPSIYNSTLRMPLALSFCSTAYTFSNADPFASQNVSVFPNTKTAKVIAYEWPLGRDLPCFLSA